MNHTKTNCRTFEGRQVGTIDAIITLCRHWSIEYSKKVPRAVKHALIDLANDKDFHRVLDCAREAQWEDIENLNKSPNQDGAYIKLADYQRSGVILTAPSNNSISERVEEYRQALSKIRRVEMLTPETEAMINKLLNQK